MNERDFWYVVCEGRALRGGRPVGRTILGEPLVAFRGADGAATVLQDRCAHRAGKLSAGRVRAGCLECPYHGWTYAADGQVVRVPSEGPDQKPARSRRGRVYPTREVDGLVFVCLAEGGVAAQEPFRSPQYGAPGWRTVRLVNRFANGVTNCAENFIDIPHTSFVHRGVFRSPRGQELQATIERAAGSVRVTYRNEDTNLGLFARFLNPGGGRIEHVDSFHVPNVTSVEYRFGGGRAMFITSQSVPERDTVTLVYTDLTFRFGVWTPFAAPIVRWQGQVVIDQDLVALREQQEVLDRFGAEFQNTAADAIHVMVESLRDALARGEDPRALPDKRVDVRFWV